MKRYPPNERKKLLAEYNELRGTGMTMGDAAHKLNTTPTTLRKWSIELKIPLVDKAGKPSEPPQATKKKKTSIPTTDRPPTFTKPLGTSQVKEVLIAEDAENQQLKTKIKQQKIIIAALTTQIEKLMGDS